MRAITLQQALRLFVDFLKETVTRALKKTTQSVCTVLIGHNESTFHTPILLPNGEESFIDDLTSIKDIRVGDSRVLFMTLIKTRIVLCKTMLGSFRSRIKHYFTSVCLMRLLMHMTP